MSDLESYRRKGLGARMGFGRSPAVVVVDFIVGFTDAESPLAGDLGAQVEATRRLLDAARAASRPIVHTTTAYREGLADAGYFPFKVPSLGVLLEGSRWVELDPRLGRRADEDLLVKKYASAFFGTPLASLLTARSIDTLLITGCTTSGCVRATAVDALQNGFRPMVVEECVGDRSEEAHRANLFDIEGKYGDVVSLEEALAHVGSFGPSHTRQKGTS